MGWAVNATPRPFYPRERPGAHCVGGWVGPRVGLELYSTTVYLTIFCESVDKQAENNFKLQTLSV
jgi:hypothetical protein